MHLPWRPGDADSRDQLGQLPLRSPRCGLGPSRSVELLPGLTSRKRPPHTAQGLSVSTLHGDLLWCDGGWPGSCHEHELLVLSGLTELLDATGSPP